VFGWGPLQTNHAAPAWHWPIPAFVRRWRETKGQYDIDDGRWQTQPVTRWAEEALEEASKWQPVWPDAVGNHLVAGSVTSEHLKADGLAWTGANKALQTALAGIQEAHNRTQEDFVLDSEWHSNPHLKHVHVTRKDVAIGTEVHEQMELYNKAIRDYGSRPWSLPPRRELEVLKVVDVEPEWDVATMVDAHRNHCTALERPLAPTQGLVGATPIFAEVATYLFDPRHEMGPRQRSWHRQNRTQPTRTARAKRKERK
jgi:hypothetical protein